MHYSAAMHIQPPALLLAAGVLAGAGLLPHGMAAEPAPSRPAAATANPDIARAEAQLAAANANVAAARAAFSCSEPSSRRTWTGLLRK